MQSTFNRSQLTEKQKPFRSKAKTVQFDPNKSTNTKIVIKRHSKAEIDAVRKSLPIYEYRDALVHAFQEHQNVIVVGETGSGKTTQVPQYIYEAGLIDTSDDAKECIAITQPRRVAAMTLAQRVSDEFGCELGTSVGYTIRFDDKTDDTTKLKFLTDGMLLREIQIDPLLLRYKVIILDEAHERTLNTDILFGLLKQLQETHRSDLKIVVMSATLDAEKFSKYLNDAPVALIPGRTHHVDVHYLNNDADISNTNELLVSTVMQIHQEMPVDGDILVFLSGSDEIITAQEAITQRSQMLYQYWQAYHSNKIVGNQHSYPSDDPNVIPEKDNLLLISELPPPDLCVIPLYSTLSPEQQLVAFEPAPAGTRKVILSTNIAETSVTISGVKYVIDTGFSKVKEINAQTGIGSLQNHIISRAEAQQRTGRAGREQPGVCYRLYSEDAFEETFEATPVPEIQRTSLINASLQLRALNILNLQSFPFIDPPPSDAIDYATKQLFLYNAILPDGSLTELGKLMSVFPIEPVFARMLILSACPALLNDMTRAKLHGKTTIQSLQQDDIETMLDTHLLEDHSKLPFPPCSEEMCIIIAALSVDSLVVPIANIPSLQVLRHRVGMAQQEFYSSYGDLFFYYHILRHFLSLSTQQQRQQWCKQYYFNFKNLSYAMNVYQQLCILLLSSNLPLRSCFDYYIQYLALKQDKNKDVIDTSGSKKSQQPHQQTVQQKQAQLYQRLSQQYSKMRYNYNMFLNQLQERKNATTEHLSTINDLNNIDPSVTKQRHQKVIQHYLNRQRILAAELGVSNYIPHYNKMNEGNDDDDDAKGGKYSKKQSYGSNVANTLIDGRELLGNEDLSWENGIAKCLCAGLIDNYVYLDQEGHFVDKKQHQRAYLHPTSCLNHYVHQERLDFKELRSQVDKDRREITKNKNIVNKQAYIKAGIAGNGQIPRTFNEFTSYKHLLFYELLITKQRYMRGILRISDDWLTELAHPIIRTQQKQQQKQQQKAAPLVSGNMSHDSQNTGINNSYFGQRSAHSVLTGNVLAQTVSLGSGQQETQLKRRRVSNSTTSHKQATTTPNTPEPPSKRHKNHQNQLSHHKKVLVNSQAFRTNPSAHDQHSRRK